VSPFGITAAYVMLSVNIRPSHEHSSLRLALTKNALISCRLLA